LHKAEAFQKKALTQNYLILARIFITKTFFLLHLLQVSLENANIHKIDAIRNFPQLKFNKYYANVKHH
jgi:hypothetical protein